MVNYLQNQFTDYKININRDNKKYEIENYNSNNNENNNKNLLFMEDFYKSINININ